MIYQVLYVCASLAAFFITDYFLEGKYKFYGKDYLDWSHQNNTMQYTKLTRRTRAHAGTLFFEKFSYLLINSHGYGTLNSFFEQFSVLFQNREVVLITAILRATHADKILRSIGE